MRKKYFTVSKLIKLSVQREDQALSDSTICIRNFRRQAVIENVAEMYKKMKKNIAIDNAM